MSRERTCQSYIMLKCHHFSAVGLHAKGKLKLFFGSFLLLTVLPASKNRALDLKKCRNISKCKLFGTWCLYTLPSEAWKCITLTYFSRRKQRAVFTGGVLFVSFHSQGTFWRPRKFTQMLLGGATALHATAARLNWAERKIQTANCWIMMQHRTTVMQHRRRPQRWSLEYLVFTLFSLAFYYVLSHITHTTWNICSP